ncbi:MAG: glycosyltransferase [Lachnospiraceae bacterium]|nr:glycosyltransferase [Lachnospiraceae bacterium]
MPKLSIVIPIYNTEKYLRECLDSVVSQTLRDIEIILVDDGSTDGSVDICREYAATDSRIHVITQENAGAAAARRTGANAATGEYIGFVDSDDFIEPDMYETLLSYMGDYDLVTSAAGYADGRVWKDHLPAGTYRSQSEMQDIIDNMIVIGNSFKRGISSSMVCKLFRTGLVRKVFNEVDTRIYCSEDVEFICRYVLQCKAVCITHICKYHYRDRTGSLVHSVHPDYLENLNYLYLSLRNAVKGHCREKRLLEQLQMLIAQYWTRNLCADRMGFSSKARMVKYISPLYNAFAGKKVALYGAGLIGKDFYLHMARIGSEPVIWVDKQYEAYCEEYPVCPVEALKYAEYDVLLVAVKKQVVAEEITQELIGMGIKEDKIFWEEPILIV